MSISELDELWLEIKKRYPIGSVIEGVVCESAQFGLFVDIGYGCRPSRELTGIIEIVASKSLSKDFTQWPRVGEIILGEVFFFREKQKEVDLRIQNISRKI